MCLFSLGAFLNMATPQVRRGTNIFKHFFWQTQILKDIQTGGIDGKLLDVSIEKPWQIHWTARCPRLLGPSQ